MDNELKRKLNNVDWETVLPELYAYALARYKYPCLQTSMSPKDLADEAIKRVLCGERKWDYERHPDIVIHFKLVIKSIVSHSLDSIKAEEKCNEELSQVYRSKIRNHHTKKDTEEFYKDTLIEIENCVQDDEDLLLLYYAMQEGHFSDKDLSVTLDKGIQEIRKMKKRMRRRIANIGDKSGIICRKN